MNFCINRQSTGGSEDGTPVAFPVGWPRLMTSIHV
jgi:hypothetical protein